jgi:hypothetical protein
MWGGSAGVAYLMQGAATVAVATALVWLWRSPALFAWKAAALAIATVVGTPFSLDYDMTMLAVAVAFLAVDGLDQGFAPWQKTTIAALWLAPLVARPIASAIHLPVGVIAMLAAFAFVIWRCQPASASPSGRR